MLNLIALSRRIGLFMMVAVTVKDEPVRGNEKSIINITDYITQHPGDDHTARNKQVDKKSVVTLVPDILF